VGRAWSASLGPDSSLRSANFRLHRRHLGPLLGRRVCLLTHTGRSTGRPRQVVLEVAARDPRTGAVHLAAGLGSEAQWYRNVQHDPQVILQIGGRRSRAVARPTAPEESGRALAAYPPRHPRTARRLMGICGIETDGTEEDYYLVGRHLIPFVELVPVRD
jgi:deazaflavin-dependent oxidoreductase (nitroreductase family)